jgi:hypothetical protein
MGIRFYCPNGHKLNVKEFQAGRRGICPFCGAKTQIPTQSTRPPSRKGEKEEKDPEEMIVAMMGDEPGSDAVEELSFPAPASKEAAQPVVAKVPSPSAPAIVPKAGEPGAPAENKEERPAPGPTPRHDATKPVQSPAAPGDAQPSASPPPVEPPGPPPAIPAAPPDPIAEAPEKIWYVRPPLGGQFGPAAGDVMRAWLAEGRVSADSLVWREGWRDWQEAALVFPQLADRAAASQNETLPVGVPAAATFTAPHVKPRRQLDGGLLAVIILLAAAVAVMFAILMWMVISR